MRSWTVATWNLLAAVVFAGGCAGDLSEQLNKSDPADPNTPTVPGQSGRVTNTQDSSGAVASIVNAADTMSWVYFQFAGAKEVTPQDPLNSTEWDLALQRFQIKVNGGISGKGGVEVALMNGTAFDTLAQAPKGGYVTDQADGSDEDSDPDYAFVQGGTWYNYNTTTHILTPKDQVYVVHAATGGYYKVQITGYYDKAGSSGYPAFRWKATTAP